ncbi:MAG TPA: sigma 54-interacting transcriptional regulator [Patescibacteria group bacterium]|nr:sigma 54-interacting transcriptional regulator [Patescibacteria group bacterium]
MIRERRSRVKLEQYYRKFVEEEVMDPNVHPWVAESWEESRRWGVDRKLMRLSVRLQPDELTTRRGRHQDALDYLDGLYEEIREYFTTYNLSMLLLDQECYVLKNYAMPFFQKSAGELEGSRLTEADIGASSIGIAYRHRTPFLLFGPEMWVEECQSGDACSAPVMVEGRLRFMLSIVAVEQDELPFNSMVSLLLTLRTAMEQHLSLLEKLRVRETILDSLPLTAYHILPGGEVAYANRLGAERLNGGSGGFPNLGDAVLNYRHTLVYKGFYGLPSHNREMTWITPQKTYEDIVTVEPLLGEEGEVESVAAVSLPIENLRTLMAHTAGYSARYSLASMVGKTPVFITMQEKATRIARQQGCVLLQGEAGTGKQRLAHGIHQASPRAAGPMIAIRCGKSSAEALETELFGGAERTGEERSGKLALATGGTLFLDEVEKMPLELQQRLYEFLNRYRLPGGEENGRPLLDIRIFAACDGDLRRLTERVSFCPELYELLSKTVIRVPSLRARREDLPLLAAHIIEEMAALHGMAPKSLSEASQARILSYDWPGNIKQLQGVVEQAFFRTAGTAIEADDIQLPGEGGGGTEWKEDREAFVAAWRAAGGNISRLAHMLDVSRVTLYRYLKKYELEK